MKILITGGAGCLGSSLIEKYLPLGHEILVIDNFATGKKQVVPETKGLTLIEGTIANKELVDKVFNDFKPEIVINSAASYKDPSNWAEDVNTNVTGTIHVVKAAIENNVERFINFQTALCYGRPQSLPIPITHPTAPFTSYGISKTAGEAFILNAELPTVSLRLANICGPRLAIGPIPTFYTRLKTEKSCFCSDSVRDFIDMEDFLSLMDKVILPGAPTGVYNVSTGVGASIKDVFDTVAKYLKIAPPEVPVVPVGNDDVQSVILDPSVTEQTFGWKASFDFEATINRQLNWYDKYGVTDIFSHLSVPK
ncbi:MAG: NAD-dependent epimerase/dehydratase family protein [Sphingobacteriia bacterium]|jgi:nucleoside-diphosphate-sugar epimerase